MASTASIAADLRHSLSQVGDQKARIALLASLVTYRLVDDPALLRAVQAMRYRAYRREGAVGDRESELLDDRYDRSINAASFAILFAGHLCASIRLHFAYDWQRESPACEAFPDEIDPLLTGGERVIDPNCFCVDPGIAGAVPEFAYATLRLPYVAAGLRRHTSVVATVRAEHMAFYRRVLRGRLVTQPRPYPGRTKDLGLMIVDYDREGQAIVGRFPFFAARPGEARALGLTRIDGGLRPSHRHDEALLAGRP